MKYVNPDPNVDEPMIVTRHVIDESDYLERKSVYFAFLDVLGFNQAFDESDNRGMSHEFAQKYRNVFIYYFDLMNASGLLREHDGISSHAGQISDSLYFY